MSREGDARAEYLKGQEAAARANERSKRDGLAAERAKVAELTVKITTGKDSHSWAQGFQDGLEKT